MSAALRFPVSGYTNPIRISFGKTPGESQEAGAEEDAPEPEQPPAARPVSRTRATAVTGLRRAERPTDNRWGLRRNGTFNAAYLRVLVESRVLGRCSRQRAQVSSETAPLVEAKTWPAGEPPSTHEDAISPTTPTDRPLQSDAD
jgi:hypothetical protein